MSCRIFIPFVNRVDLMCKAINSTGSRISDVIVLDNSGNKSIAPFFPSVRWWVPAMAPLTFAQSQNWFASIAKEQGDKYYLFMHSDAEAVGDSVKQLSELAESLIEKEEKWGAIWTNYDALAAINLEALKAIGGWDVNLPQYFCDNSTYRSMKLAGYECIDSGLPVIHTASQTINSDPRLKFLNLITFPLHERYYQAKWGGSPGHETFTKPFNGRCPE